MSFKYFLIGFAIGASIGATIVLLSTPQSGKALRAAITAHVREAIREGKKAAVLREQQLWEEFRSHLQGTVPPRELATRTQSS